MTYNCPCVGTTHNYTIKQVSHCQRSMREFWENRKEECKGGTPVAAPSTDTVMDFPTGSTYKGVLYRGEFEDGMCHGNGDLVYKHGPKDITIIRGLWKKGILKDGKIYFNGILEYNKDDWSYCKMPDRRYGVEFNKELNPAGKSNITAAQPPRKIPPGFQDNGYGFYNPKTKTVYKYHNELEVAKAPSDREQRWIEDNCRMEPMTITGPRPDLYETWLGPDVDPPQLPKLLVGFTPLNSPSMIDKMEDQQKAKPVFYDCNNSDCPRPPRKFQPPQNKDK